MKLVKRDIPIQWRLIINIYHFFHIFQTYISYISIFLNFKQNLTLKVYQNDRANSIDLRSIIEWSIDRSFGRSSPGLVIFYYFNVLRGVWGSKEVKVLGGAGDTLNREYQVLWVLVLLCSKIRFAGLQNDLQKYLYQFFNTG